MKKIKQDKISIIVEILKSIKPYKIILFGSQAYGEEREDSDIDLLVVTNDNVMPKNFNESMQYYFKVADTLDEIRENVPMDLIVHTIPMFKRFLELDSMFSREVLRNGKILYERDYERMAWGIG